MTFPVAEQDKEKCPLLGAARALGPGADARPLCCSCDGAVMAPRDRGDGRDVRCPAAAHLARLYCKFKAQPSSLSLSEITCSSCGVKNNKLPTGTTHTRLETQSTVECFQIFSPGFCAEISSTQFFFLPTKTNLFLSLSGENSLTLSIKAKRKTQWLLKSVEPLSLFKASY